MARQTWNSLFHDHADGSVEPKVRVRVEDKNGSAEFGPGVRFGTGVAFGGVNIAQHKGCDVECETLDNGTVVISKFYE